MSEADMKNISYCFDTIRFFISNRSNQLIVARDEEDLTELLNEYNIYS